MPLNAQWTPLALLEEPGLLASLEGSMAKAGEGGEGPEVLPGPGPPVDVTNRVDSW